MKNLGGVTKEVAYQLVNNLSFLAGVKHQYSDQFAKEGAKIGQQLDVKFMDNISITRGPTMVERNLVERTIPVTITVNNWYQGALAFSDLDYKLSVEAFDEKTNLTQIVAKMANEMEWDALQLALSVPNAIGTLGTTPGTAGGVGLAMTAAPQIFGNAGSVLTELGTPAESRSICMNPTAMTTSVGALAALQNPAPDISSQFRKGLLAHSMNFDYVENVNIPSITTGTRTNGTVLVGSLDGATTLQVTGLGANATIAAGERFTVAGVLAINPMNQQFRPFPRMFVVTAATVANAAGQATLPVSPTMKLSNPEVLVGGVMTKRFPLLPLEVNGNVSALPLAGAVVTWQGAVNTVGVCNLANQKDAIVMTTVDLPIHDDASKCVQMRYKNVSVRLWQGADFKNSRGMTRIDAVAVFTLVRPDLACVIWG